MENERGLTVRASFMVIGALAAAMVTEIDGGSADLWLWLNRQLRVGDGKHTGFESLQDLKQRPNPETHREIDLQRERERERERGCDVFGLWFGELRNEEKGKERNVI